MLIYSDEPEVKHGFKVLSKVAGKSCTLRKRERERGQFAEEDMLGLEVYVQGDSRVEMSSSAWREKTGIIIITD